MAEENTTEEVKTETTAETTSTETTQTTETKQAAETTAETTETTETTEQADWRKLLAGEDAEAIKQLERFNDPQSLLKSYNEAQKTIRESGRVKIPGKDATPEEISAWNKARGVPDKPADYKITAKPAEGYEVTADDKAALALLTEKLHQNGADPAVVNAAHEVYYAMAEEASNRFLERSAEIHVETQEALKKQWIGHRYQENMNWANAAVSQFGLEKIMEIPVMGGGYLGDNQDFIKAMASIGRLNAEDPYFLKAAGSPGSIDPDARLKELQGLYRTNQKEYNSPKVQAEIASILAAQERRESRTN